MDRNLSISTDSVHSRLSLRANFSWTFVGNVVYAICQWAMLVILVKVGSPEMVGQFTLGLTIATPVLAFATLKTRLVQATDVEQDYTFGDYFGLRLITTALALLFIVGIVLVSNYRWETLWVILGVAIAKAFESISDVLYGLFQQNERMDRVGKSKMIRGPLALFALGLGVYITGRLFWGVVGLAIAWALVLISYDLRSGASMLKLTLQPAVFGSEGREKSVLRPRWEISTLARLAWLSLPLGIVVTLESLKTSIPRYFIVQYLGEFGLGIFAPMAYFKQAGNLVAIALGLSACPRLAKYYTAKNDPSYRRLLYQLVGIGVLIGVAGVVVSLFVGPELLSLIYEPRYAGYHDLFVMLMVAAGLDYVATFLDYGMTAARYFRPQIPLFTAVTVATVIACILLIPPYGLQGAAMAVILSSLVRLGASLIIIVYIMRVHDKITPEEEHSQ